ncbi:hypothetical protein FHS96_000278 [Sphingomonas zeicaulis]
MRGYPVTAGLHKVERSACFTLDGITAPAISGWWRAAASISSGATAT